MESCASTHNSIMQQSAGDLVELVCADFSNLDISPIISVVLLFLVPGCLQALQATLASCVNSGARVASYHFPVCICALHVLSDCFNREIYAQNNVFTDSRLATVRASGSGSSFQPRSNEHIVYLQHHCTLNVHLFESIILRPFQLP